MSLGKRMCNDSGKRRLEINGAECQFGKRLAKTSEKFRHDR